MEMNLRKSNEKKAGLNKRVFALLSICRAVDAEKVTPAAWLEVDKVLYTCASVSQYALYLSL